MSHVGSLGEATRSSSSIIGNYVAYGSVVLAAAEEALGLGWEEEETEEQRQPQGVRRCHSSSLSLKTFKLTCVARDEPQPSPAQSRAEWSGAKDQNQDQSHVSARSPGMCIYSAHICALSLSLSLSLFISVSLCTCVYIFIDFVSS